MMQSTVELQQVRPGLRSPLVRGPWVQVVPHLHPRYGGLSAAVPDLARSLANGVGGEPMDVALAAFCAQGEHYIPAGFSPEQLTYWPLARKPWLSDYFRGQALHRSFRELLRGAAGIHIHGLWEQSTALAAAEARSLKVPYVMSAHGMLEPWALENKKLKKLVYAALVERANVAGARALHALTQAEARQFVGFGARSPIAVIPNAVDLPDRADASLFLRDFPELRGKRLVLFLARLHPKKGLDLLLEAWAEVVADFPDAHLVVAGPDSEGTLARLRHFVADRGLVGNVCFAGLLQGAMKWSALAAAEAFVLPSFSEGQSVGVLEAMGMGLPVIVTEACNMPEVRELDLGWTIQPHLEPLTNALRELLRGELMENLDKGIRGAALVQSRYSWPVVAQQMAELYSWIIGGAMPSSVDLTFPA